VPVGKEMVCEDVYLAGVVSKEWIYLAMNGMLGYVRIHYFISSCIHIDCSGNVLLKALVWLSKNLRLN